jgi:hypothetical protein
MRKICSHHYRRGERIKEFNIPPSFLHFYPSRVIAYRDQVIPVVSEGWVVVDGTQILEMQTAGGPTFTLNITYKLL